MSNQDQYILLKPIAMNIKAQYILAKANGNEQSESIYFGLKPIAMNIEAQYILAKANGNEQSESYFMLEQTTTNIKPK